MQRVGTYFFDSRFLRDGFFVFASCSFDLPIIEHGHGDILIIPTSD